MGNSLETIIEEEEEVKRIAKQILEGLNFSD